MAVIKAKRREGRYSVYVKAKQLCVYTMTICKNESSFPRRNRWILTQRLVDEASKILSCVRMGLLDTHPLMTKNPLKYREFYEEAFLSAETLLTLIDVSYNIFNLDSKRVEYWTSLVVDVEKSIIKKLEQYDKAT